MSGFSPYGRKRFVEIPEPAAPYVSRIPADAMTVELSKSLAAELAAAGHMSVFLAELAAWAQARGLDGYSVRSEPLEGPGTMVWRATR